MRRSPLFWLVIATLALTVTWYVVTPRRAWERFNRALVLADPAELQATIDYPILRENLKRDLGGAISVRPGLEGVVAQLGGSLIDPLVDAAITPEGMSRLLAGFGSRRTANDDGSMFTRSEVRFRYRSPSRVDVRVTPEGGGASDGGVFTFQRHRTTWRLTRITGARTAAEENGS